MAVAMLRDGNWKPAAAPLESPIIVALTPALIAPLGAINATLVVTDVAELGVECTVARQMGRVSCCRSLAATANIFIEPGPVTGDVGAHYRDPRVIAAEVLRATASIDRLVHH